MDVVTQAALAAAGASRDRAERLVTLEFDLDRPSHRAAYAAAVAVLGTIDNDAAVGHPDGPASTREAMGGGNASGSEVESNPVDNAIRRAYRAAVDGIAGDPARVEHVVADTFSVVREILRNGANVEAVAQVQYARWLDGRETVTPLSRSVGEGQGVGA